MAAPVDTSNPGTRRHTARRIEHLESRFSINGKASSDRIPELRTELFANGSKFEPVVRDEIIGIDRVMDEVDEIINWLNDPHFYERYGSRLEPGAAFEGEPGTGKTLVARYIATASNALFINIRDFAHDGDILFEQDIGDLFNRAREAYKEHGRPVLLFWDEFETNAKERSVGGTPAQNAAVSRLTAELDGVHGKPRGVFLIGCTNYFHVIDAALIRPGRLGTHLRFHAPDRKGKEEIIEYYLGSTKLLNGDRYPINIVDDLDYENLSYFFNTEDTAADIEEACVESWRLAVRRARRLGNEPVLHQKDIVDTFLKRLIGIPRMFTKVSHDTLRKIALHESGHALMALILGIPLRLITVQAGDNTLGRTFHAEIEEHVAAVAEIEKHVRVTLGSIAAEEACGVAPHVGSAGDIQQATSLSSRLVDDMYVGRETGLLNPRTLHAVRATLTDHVSPAVSDDYMKRADNDTNLVLAKANSDARQIMSRVGAEKLWALADSLIAETTIIGSDFKAIAEEICGDLSEYNGATQQKSLFV